MTFDLLYGKLDPSGSFINQHTDRSHHALDSDKAVGKVISEVSELLVSAVFAVFYEADCRLIFLKEATFVVVSLTL